MNGQEGLMTPEPIQTMQYLYHADAQRHFEAANGMGFTVRLTNTRKDGLPFFLEIFLPGTKLMQTEES